MPMGLGIIFEQTHLIATSTAEYVLGNAIIRQAGIAKLK